MEYSRGIDVSVYQDRSDTKDIHIDFTKAVENDIDFVFIRSSIGISEDRDFQLNRKNAKKAGLWRGFYHFLKWEFSGATQAKFFYELIKDDLPEIGLVVDFEQNYKTATPATAKILLRDFLEELRKLYSGHIIIYTGAFFWKQYGSTDDYFKQFPLWLASYTTQEYMEQNIGKMLQPWTTWTFWQNSSKGNGLKLGMESLDLDLDYFNGTKEELLAFCGLNDPETETEILLKNFESELEKAKADVDALIVYSYQMLKLVREMKQLEK